MEQMRGGVKCVRKPLEERWMRSREELTWGSLKALLQGLYVMNPLKGLHVQPTETCYGLQV
jgi:hypothetical protein